jgi:hypothetical protein
MDLTLAGSKSQWHLQFLRNAFDISGGVSSLPAQKVNGICCFREMPLTFRESFRFQS